MKRAFVKTALIISLAIPAYASALIAPSPICTSEYAPVCGQKYSSSGITRNTYSNMCQLNADGATYMSSGVCDQNPYYPYYPYNPYNPYTPYNPQPYYPYYGSAPSIQSFTGPTTLRTNETGTWYVNVGSSTGTLSYSIIWGDEMNYAYANAQSMQSYTTQQTTFTHSYTNPGTYTVIITARDTVGRVAQATATVTVTQNQTYYPYNPYPYNPQPYYPYTYNPYQYNYNYSYWNSDNDYNDVDDWNYWWEYSSTPTQNRRKTYTQYDYNYYNSYNDYYGSSYGGQYYDDYNYYNNSFNYDDSGWYPNYSYTWQ